jgi:hypothetical protein
MVNLRNYGAKLNWMMAASMLFASATFAQQVTGTLRGIVTDATGAVIRGSSVSVKGASGERSTVTGLEGSYVISGLIPGAYTIEVQSAGFARFSALVTVQNGRAVSFPVQLRVSGGLQEITVEGEAEGISVDPESNASSQVFRGSDLDALPDDAGDLQDILQAIVGPGVGSNGAQISVDGFANGRLPPKNTISEIRVNRNPYSAENDWPFGRIDIITKAGTDKLHGAFGFYDSDAMFNSRNPFAANKADYSNRMFNGNISGAFNPRTSFFLTFNRNTLNTGALIHAVGLDPASLTPVAINMSVLAPRRDFDVGPRMDFTLSPKHTFTSRYQYGKSVIDRNGIGQYNLESRAYPSDRIKHELRLSETSALNAKSVSETKFGYFHESKNQYGDNAVPALVVYHSFNGGGSQTGRTAHIDEHFELQNSTSISRNTHTFRFGGRIRHDRVYDRSSANFGGTFTFLGISNAPVLGADDRVLTNADGQRTTTAITSLEQYRRTLLFQRLGYSTEQIRTLGGGASQFSIAAGNPLAEIRQTDIGLFIEDDWRVRPNFTASFGFRYEAQTNIHDLGNIGPRLGLAWSPGAETGKSSKTVIRTGVGAFYYRVPSTLPLQELRFNGLTQQQFVVTSPDFFPDVPALALLATEPQTVAIHKIDPNLKASFLFQSSIGLEQQLARNTTVSATYYRLQNTHMIRSVNINTPLPGTYDPARSLNGVRPYGNGIGNLILDSSDGAMRQNMVLATISTRPNAQITVNAYYMFLSVITNVDDFGQIASNAYDFKQDYGRPSWDRRHSFNVSGTVILPRKVQFSPFIIISSGQPYDLITGVDLNGDTVANDRPAFATDLSRPSVVLTRFGALDTKPSPGQRIVPRNYLTGNGMWNFNMRVGRTFAFGKMTKPARPASGPQRAAERHYSVDLNVEINNVFNHLNPGGYVGNLSSPLFGQPTSIYLFRETSNNRRIQFGMQFTF